MISSDIIYTIARTFPESIAVILAGFILLGMKKDKVYIIKQGLILGMIIFIIRRLPINFGIHTILGTIAIAAMLSKIYKESLIKPIIATCGIMIILSISEAIYVLIATGILNIDIDTLLNNSGLEGALVTLPSLLIFLVLVNIFSKIQKKLRLTEIKDSNS